MRSFSDTFAAHIAGEATTLCRCWRATRRDGAVLGFTDHDADLSFDGTLFRAGTGLSAAETTTGSGFAVGGGEAAGALGSDSLSEADLAAGLWDSARVEVFLVNWRTAPSATINGGFTLLGGPSPTGLGFAQATPRGVEIQAAISGGSVGGAALLRAAGSLSSSLDFSAEL